MGNTFEKEIKKVRRYSLRRPTLWFKIEQQVEAEFDRQKLCYRPESLDQLVKRSKFNRKEIQLLYRSFKENCPNGLVTQEKFQQIFAQYFYYGRPETYADMVFSTFDEDGNGEISFEEFVQGLSTLCRGTNEEKLEWVFDLYDCNHRGYITKQDLLRVVKAVYEMMGGHSDRPVTKEDVLEHVEEVFTGMDKDGDGRITLEEFIQLCTSNQTIITSLTILTTTVY